ncbi:MAG: acyl-CoA dehydrogenase family protein [Candidatus Binatia bacterium]|nr:acyl-CoA dehydrogenase family protein [Candidatus Binatia bacterium]
MIEWSEQHEAMRDAFKKFVEAEIKPNLEELEHGDTPPYAVLRKMFDTFGIGAMQADRFKRQLERERAKANGTADESADKGSKEKRGVSIEAAADAAAMQLIPIIELCHYCPGLITAMGVSVALTGGAIRSKGTIAQKEKFVPPLLTMEKIGAWAITEPGSGSDAFGSMKSSARRDGDDYVLNGSKTFITNGPYADTIVFICKLDEGNEPRERKVLSFILDKGTPGLTQSKPLRKMGLHSSPTGELFLEDVRVGRDRLIGETEEGPARSGAKDTFGTERIGVVAMALGIIEQCLSLSLEYARTRVQFGKPIGEFQLIQAKLAEMEVARMNLQNIVFQQIERASLGKNFTLAEASAGKLYAARAAMSVSLEAVQLFGGNGYMAEFQVEQLCRDAKVLQIYAGTDEIQISQIARSLLGNGAA